jgi:hypothetical protein
LRSPPNVTEEDESPATFAPRREVDTTDVFYNNAALRATVKPDHRHSLAAFARCSTSTWSASSSA